MSETGKKQNFLQGAALLAIATAIVKIIGAFYKLPLNMAIGAEGYSYFTTAYDIYSVMLLVSTAGLPVAVSRMVSQASTLGAYTRLRKIFRTALIMFAVLGGLTSVLMIFGAKPLANLMNQPDAWISIACLGPCGILICLMSAYRGYFNGQGNMAPTSITQVIEAVIKLVVGLALAFVIIRATRNVALAAGGAIIGVTMGSALALIYMLGKFRRSYKSLPVTPEAPGSTRGTLKELLAIAIPITIGSAGLQILTMLETKIYMGQLLGLGLTQAEADNMKGIYNMCQTIYNMPCAFITPITISIIPAITASLTLLDHKSAKATEESAARVMGLICMPCVFGLATLAGPVTALLGGYSGENLTLSTQLMSIMGFNIIFNAVVLLTNAMMQAHGHAVVPVVNMFVAGILRLAVVYMLTGNPNIGIVGIPVGAMICFVCIAVLNLFSMGRVMENPPAIVKNLLKPFLAAAIMGACVYGALQLLMRLGVTSRLILCGLPIAVGVVVYCIAAVWLKAITREDCLLLPKGAKIAKLLHL